MCSTLRGSPAALVLVLALVGAVPSVHADEIWVAPTYQQDLGGLGIGSNGFWPATAVGAVRFAFAVPSDLQTFQAAKILLIPHASSGAAMLNVFICAATSGAPVAGACVGPFSHPFDSVANRLTEVDISASVAPHLGAPSNRPYLAVLAYTTPATTTDHFVGLRFASKASDATPQGAIMAFAGGVAPTGWLLADGSEVSRVTYAALYAAIGNAYGAGDGATTFNLPNLQQRFPIGRAPAGRASVLGEAGGVIDHVHNYSDVPTHVHPVDPPLAFTDSSGLHFHPATTDWGWVGAADSFGPRRPLFGFKPDDAFDPEVPIVNTGGVHDHRVNILQFNSGDAAGGVAMGTTNAQNPPYLTVHYIIKY